MPKNHSLLKYLNLELPLFAVLATGLPLRQYRTWGITYLIPCLALTLIFGQAFRRYKGSKGFLFLAALAFIAAGFHKHLFASFGHSKADMYFKNFAFVFFLPLLSLLVSESSLFAEDRRKRLALAALSTLAVFFWPPFILFYYPVLPVLLAFKHPKGKQAEASGFFQVVSWLAPVLLFLILLLMGQIIKEPLFIFSPPRSLRISEFVSLAQNAFAFLPLFIFLALAWRKLLKSNKNKTFRNLFLMAIAYPIAVLTLTFFFAYTANSSRTFHLTALLFGQISLLACLSLPLEEGYGKALRDFAKKLTDKPLLLLVATVYMLKVWNYFNPY